MQDLVLNRLELPLVLGALDDELVLLLLQVGALLRTDDARSWSCKPSGVIMKLSSVTLTDTSGT